MVRFIFVCMVIVALTLVSVPVRSVYDGIQNKRDAVIAQLEADEAAQAQLAEITINENEDIFTADIADEPSADDLNAIATAAGGYSDVIDPDEGFGPGFSDVAPSALSEPVAAAPTDEPQAN